MVQRKEQQQLLHHRHPTQGSAKATPDKTSFVTPLNKAKPMAINAAYSSPQQGMTTATRSQGRGCRSHGGHHDNRILKELNDSKGRPSPPPRYMKHTTSSDAKKDDHDNKVTTKRHASTSAASSKDAKGKKKPAASSSRPKGRVLFPVVVSGVSRATCSSTLKDTKFPSFLDLEPGATVADGRSTMRVCPYTYCSLNGCSRHHGHESYPPLKAFLALRRKKLILPQKSMKTEGVSPFRKRQKEEGVKISPLMQEAVSDFFVEIYTSPVAATDDREGKDHKFNDDAHKEEDDRAPCSDASEEEMDAVVKHVQYVGHDQFDRGEEEMKFHRTFEEQIDDEQTELQEESGAYDLEPINSTARMNNVDSGEAGEEEHGEIDTYGEKDSRFQTPSAYDEDLEELFSKKFDSDSSDEVGLSPVSFYENSRVFETTFGNKTDSEEFEAKEDQSFELAEHSNPVSSEVGVKDSGSFSMEVHGEDMNADVISAEERSDMLPSEENSLEGGSSDEKNAPEEYEGITGVRAPLTVDEDELEVQCDGLDDECDELHLAETGVWAPVTIDGDVTPEFQYHDQDKCEDRQPKSGLTVSSSSEDGTPVSDEQNTLFSRNICEEEVKGAVGIMQEGDIEGNTFEETKNDQPAGGPEVEVSEIDELCEEFSCMNLRGDVWSDDLDDAHGPCKNRLIIARRRPTAAEMYLTRDFNPRGPRFLPEEPDPEGETVDLRHQMMDERKNAEEWMIDYALQRALSELAPSRKKKVELLVKAFETVLPTTAEERPVQIDARTTTRHSTIGACG